MPRASTGVVARPAPLLVFQVEFRLGPALRQEVDPEDLVREAWVAELLKLAEFDVRDGRARPVLRGIEQHPAWTVAVMRRIVPAAIDKRYSRALGRLRDLLPKSVFEELEPVTG